MCGTGSNQLKNRSAAAALFKKAARLGNAEAQEQMFEHHCIGGAGVPLDYSEGIRWLRMAAENGR